MAVEAHHLHHLLPSHLVPTREVANAVESQQNYSPYMGLLSPAAPAGAAALPFYHPVMTAAAAGSESGVTFNNVPAAAPASSVSRKRARVESFLGEDVSAHVQQQLLDVDRLVLDHTEKLRAELAERRRRYARQVMAAVEQAAAKRLKAKDEEIERIGKLNWALEERIRSLYVETQIWRDLAQSNEAAANALRSNLEQVLEAQAQAVDKDACAGGGGAGCAGGDDVGDAESCCCGENEVAGEEEEVVGTWSSWRTCRCCGEGTADVLLLPCRHLCACAPCAAAARACPVCGSAKNGSVCVNLS